MVAIWSELLGVDRIGMHDDFLEMGGHSLLATRVLARVEDVLHVRLTLRDVFEAPTIRQLAERVGERGGGLARADNADREELEF